MKYENFSQAKNLVEQINSAKHLIRQLEGDFISIRVLGSDSYVITTIGAWDNCEHEAKDLAMQFKADLISFYTKKLDVLLYELEQL
jgi:hypothetical protein